MQPQVWLECERREARNEVGETSKFSLQRALYIYIPQALVPLLWAYASKCRCIFISFHSLFAITPSFRIPAMTHVKIIDYRPHHILILEQFSGCFLLRQEFSDVFSCQYIWTLWCGFQNDMKYCNNQFHLCTRTRFPSRKKYIYSEYIYYIYFDICITGSNHA